ncbi:hypothetical protein H4582DRAFT_169668 [Lactarius indigo]|nr:hypothetical protein H4582DRAFT_169668 [Lactarius indigo]
MRRRMDHQLRAKSAKLRSPGVSKRYTMIQQRQQYLHKETITSRPIKAHDIDASISQHRQTRKRQRDQVERWLESNQQTATHKKRQLPKRTTPQQLALQNVLSSGSPSCSSPLASLVTSTISLASYLPHHSLSYGPTDQGLSSMSGPVRKLVHVSVLSLTWLHLVVGQCRTRSSIGGLYHGQHYCCSFNVFCRCHRAEPAPSLSSHCRSLSAWGCTTYRLSLIKCSRLKTYSPSRR